MHELLIRNIGEKERKEIDKRSKRIEEILKATMQDPIEDNTIREIIKGVISNNPHRNDVVYLSMDRGVYEKWLEIYSRMIAAIITFSRERKQAINIVIAPYLRAVWSRSTERWENFLKETKDNNLLNKFRIDYREAKRLIWTNLYHWGSIPPRSAIELLVKEKGENIFHKSSTPYSYDRVGALYAYIQDEEAINYLIRTGEYLGDPLYSERVNEIKKLNPEYPNSFNSWDDISNFYNTHFLIALKKAMDFCRINNIENYIIPPEHEADILHAIFNLHSFNELRERNPNAFS